MELLSLLIYLFFCVLVICNFIDVSFRLEGKQISFCVLAKLDKNKNFTFYWVIVDSPFLKLLSLEAIEVLDADEFFIL